MTMRLPPESGVRPSRWPRPVSLTSDVPPPTRLARAYSAVRYPNRMIVETRSGRYLYKSTPPSLHLGAPVYNSSSRSRCPCTACSRPT